MIGCVRGVLLEIQPPLLTVEVQGVGYELEAPLGVFAELPPLGASVLLHTHLVIRDDAHLLYGFVRASQKRLFRALLRVTGVGPKLALALLSGMTEDALLSAVADKDAAALARTPGVGRRTAERLLVELANLKERLPSAGEVTGVSGGNASDAVAALVALGYRNAEAGQAVRAVATPQTQDTAALVRLALQRLAR
ncbi:MAG TPA: Holliday junction branch migration protein RuvA [Acidiferrobacteraceae bacterium]|nr:Holliday junction branch migration protein RuvA [Acidiferrobacteraceae bacterium]